MGVEAVSQETSFNIAECAVYGTGSLLAKTMDALIEMMTEEAKSIERELRLGLDAKPRWGGAVKGYTMRQGAAVEWSAVDAEFQKDQVNCLAANVFLRT